MTQNSIVILVADGNPADRGMLAAALKNAGYTVIQAVDGGSAVKVADDHPVDIAVINYEMTPRNGFDFARQMILRKSAIGMILTSDAAPADLLFEAKRQGIGHVFKKPVEIDRLIQLIARMTGRTAP